MADIWLEKELARQLAPVAAPESLWDRIDRRRSARMDVRSSPRRRISPEWVFWPVAAAMAVMAFAGFVLTRGAHNDFRSDNFGEIRAWVKAESNIDIAVPPGQPGADRGAVRLLGTRIIRLGGIPVAAIDYRVGDEVATLFVSGKGNTEASKRLFSSEPLYTWNVRNETYAIVFSSARNSRGACLLCHSNTPG